MLETVRAQGLPLLGNHDGCPLCDSAYVYVDAAVRVVCFYAHRLPLYTSIVAAFPLTSQGGHRPSSAATSLPDTSTALLPTPPTPHASTH
jgi:hypothetical protein